MNINRRARFSNVGERYVRNRCLSECLYHEERFISRIICVECNGVKKYCSRIIYEKGYFYRNGGDVIKINGKYYNI